MIFSFLDGLSSCVHKSTIPFTQMSGFFPWDVNFVVVWADTEFTSVWEKKIIHLNEGFWFLALARILIKS